MIISVILLLIQACLAQYSWPYPKLAPGEHVPANPELVAKYKGALGASTTVRDVVANCLNNNQWALTFDDGPGLGTDMVLGELARQNIKATFFVIGISVLNYPEELKRVIAAGHNIGIHTWNHESLISLTPEELITSIMYTYYIIKDVTGYEARLVRPPMGDRNDRVIAMVQSLGMDLVIWNRDTRDAVDGPAAAIKNIGTWPSLPHIGAISLNHDHRVDTANTIPSVIYTIKQMGYQFTLLDQCAGVSVYGSPIQPVPLSAPTETQDSSKTTETPVGSPGADKVNSNSAWANGISSLNLLLIVIISNIL